MKFHEKTNFYEGYQLALQNAKNHVEVALAAEKFSIGIANSHLILAAEEAIKANVIFLFHLDKESAQKEFKQIDKYFSSHKYKHEIIHSYESIGELMEIMLDKLLEPIMSVIDQDLSVEQMLEKKGEGYDNLIEYLEKLNTGEESLDTNQDWWKQADDNKNRGFYISHIKKSGKWDGPFKITLKQFSKSKEIVTKFVEKVEYMAQQANTPEGYKFYTEMRRKINEQKESE